MSDHRFDSGPDNSKASLELLYHISRELASDLDLQVVLRRVLQLSMDAIGSINGSIIILDSRGNAFHSAISHSGKVFDEIKNPIDQIIKKGLAGWVARHKELVIVPDTSRDDRWFKRPDDAPDKTGPKSAISVPLMARDDLVGIMTLVHPVPNTFEDSHGALLQAIADQAGITILNARLYEESRRRERAMSALAESAMAITASVGTENILNKILLQVQQALSVDAVTLSLVDAERQALVVRAITGNIANMILGTRTPFGSGVSGRVAEQGERMVIADPIRSNHFDADLQARLGFIPTAIACVPIHALGEIIGTLEAYNPETGEFSYEDIVVLSGISNMAGSVIRYAQLFEKLEAAHRRFRELFDDSIDMILITDEQGQIRQANRQSERFRKSDERDLTFKNIADLLRLEHEQSLQELHARLEKEGTISYETEVDIQEDRKWMQVYLRRIQLEGESLLQWILHDISERKEMDTLRDDLVSMIYHDLRSPLANVNYSLEMISEMLEAEGDEDIFSMIEVANRATNRIERLTDSLLDIRLLEAGQPLSNLEYVDAQELLASAFNAVRPVAHAKNQTFEMELNGFEAVVLVDKDMITRVLINLIDNAVKYTPSDGAISIGMNPDTRGILFWVKDTGQGIPEDKRTTIFDKYSRLGNKGLGFGLGLAFCRMAVEAHSGRIWIEDTESTGSRFVFNLPVHSASEKETDYFLQETQKD